MLEKLLFGLGIPTYVQSIFTPIGADPEQQINLPKQLPSQIGWIYGMSIYVDGVTPDGQNLITAAQAELFFLTIKAGMSNVLDPIRLSDLIYKQATGTDWRYMPINIPNEISLDASFYTNPTGIVNGGTPTQIMLNFRYIDMKSYNYLVDSKFLRENGIIKQPK